jgi:3D (Asp-Asp-Asp) domain-containing protein
LIRAALLALALGAAPAWSADAPRRVSLDVTATAYNSTPAQTDATPTHGAWGDDLDAAVEPGVRVLAVSQDLLARGLRRGQRVKIHGLKGEWVVLDKMPRRWTRRVDLYMQKDVRAARKWGRRRVKISWTPEG